jgi:hypothetical protein
MGKGILNDNDKQQRRRLQQRRQLQQWRQTATAGEA